MSFNDFMSMEEKLRKAADSPKSAKLAKVAKPESGAATKSAVGSDKS